jgi:hypothetical protein
MEFVHLDLIAPTSRLLFSNDTPYSDHDNGLIHPQISGDFAAVGANSNDDEKIMVMNWKTQLYFFLPLPGVRHQFI